MKVGAQVRDPGLLVGVDGERAPWAAVDINDGVRKIGLLRAPDDDDRQLEPAGVGIMIILRDADRAASQARPDFRGHIRQRTRRIDKDRFR
jgi:hypothetical protein